MEATLKDTSSAHRERLRTVPLWIGTKWRISRPIYVTDDAEIADALAHHVAVWQLPVATSVVPRLIDATGAEHLDETSFDPIVHQHAFIEGATLERQFRAAVQLLRDWLARHDCDLSNSHSLPWEVIESPRIAIATNLHLEFRVGRRAPISIPARAHVTRDPLTFYFRDAEVARADDAGGQMVAALFATGDRDKLALAWSCCWAKAASGEKGGVGLAEDMGDDSALQLLFEQAKQTTAAKRSSKVASKDKRKQSHPESCDAPPARRLKILDQLAEKSVDRVAGDDSAAAKRGRRGLRSELPPGKQIRQPTKPVPRSAPLAYSEDEKEEFALHVLQLAINGKASGLRDYRHLRGIGADAIDKLRRYFEIKVSYGELPDEVTLTGNEAERAFLEGNKFYLAVVAGLEEGYETIVNVIPNPLRKLDLKPNTSVTLTGITRCKSAIRVRFSDTSQEQ
jgi:hypothetical protein